MTPDIARPVRINVTPERPTLDTELHIRLSGLAAGVRVTIHAEATDPRGWPWRSAAVCTALGDGTVDLRRDAPLSGSYDGVDPMGLIWSMRRAGQPEPGHVADYLAPTPLRLAADVDGTEVARAEIQRLRVPGGLVRADVRENGLVGTLYRRDGDERLPGLLLLGGAEGGMHEDDAALLAGHGFAVLALAYYGMPGLPPTLRDIPLEYFDQGLDYLRRHPGVQASRLAVMGVSKGGEATLLIGSMFPGLRAVISVVGSGLVTQGISQDVLGGSFLEIMAAPVASWTYQGRELPYLPNVVTPELKAAVVDGVPVALKWAMPDPGQVVPDPATVIPVERITGAVLLISGEDDQGYGVAHHEVAARRLDTAGRPGTWRHVVHPGAGHLIAAPPYGPTTETTTPGPGITFDHGGTPAANATARAATWHEILQFLARELLPVAGPASSPGDFDEKTHLCLDRTIASASYLGPGRLAGFSGARAPLNPASIVAYWPALRRRSAYAPMMLLTPSRPRPAAVSGPPTAVEVMPSPVTGAPTGTMTAGLTVAARTIRVAVPDSPLLQSIDGE